MQLPSPLSVPRPAPANPYRYRPPLSRSRIDTTAEAHESYRDRGPPARTRPKLTTSAVLAALFDDTVNFADPMELCIVGGQDFIGTTLVPTATSPPAARHRLTTEFILSVSLRHTAWRCSSAKIGRRSVMPARAARVVALRRQRRQAPLKSSAGSTTNWRPPSSRDDAGSAPAGQPLIQISKHPPLMGGNRRNAAITLRSSRPTVARVRYFQRPTSDVRLDRPVIASSCGLRHSPSTGRTSAS